ncbi:hypothetical protein OAM86_03540 [Porticoccaceae bacterium]|nr:hypothetical protein [Porticoccaceae bacterium]
MREVFACLLIGFIAYALELNWVAVIFVLAAIGNLIPDKKSKKKTKKKKSSSKPTDLPSGKRTKLKTATKLKKTDLPAAISMLREAYDDGEAISLDEFLRLPNYLRMNKQYDEAFQECRKLAHYGFFESEKPGSLWWFSDQVKILKLEARICEEEGKYPDALATLALIYYYEIMHAEQVSKSSIYQGIQHNQNMNERGARDLESLLSDHQNWTPAFGKFLDKIGQTDKEALAIDLVANWTKGWPNEPEVLQVSLGQLLFK